MEKTHDFAVNSMRKVSEKNPVNNLKVIQLHNEIQNLKQMKGEARKDIANKLMKSVSVPPRATFCHQCGTKLTPDAAFCSKCGAKQGKMSI